MVNLNSDLYSNKYDDLSLIEKNKNIVLSNYKQHQYSDSETDSGNDPQNSQSKYLLNQNSIKEQSSPHILLHSPIHNYFCIIKSYFI